MRVGGNKVVYEGLTDFGHGPLTLELISCGAMSSSSSSRVAVVLVGTDKVEQRLSSRMVLKLQLSYE